MGVEPINITYEATVLPLNYLALERIFIKYNIKFNPATDSSTATLLRLHPSP